MMARMIALNVGDSARFESLFFETPSTVDPPLLLRAPDVAYTSTETLTEAVTKVLATDDNLGTLGPCRDSNSSIRSRLSSQTACSPSTPSEYRPA